MIGWIIAIIVAILCGTLIGLYAVSMWREVQIKEIELSLKALQMEENKRKKLN